MLQVIHARIEQDPKKLGQPPYPWPKGGDREVERRVERRIERGVGRRSPNVGAAEILIDMPSLRLDIFRTSLCPSPLTSLRYTYDVFP